MKRLLCGSVVLAASLGVISCNGDPTGDFRNGPTRINAEPSSVFLDQGTDEAVTVTLVDDQGDPLAGDFEIASTGAGITVARNDAFLGTTVGAPLESQAQFIITAGDTPTPSSFTLTAGGLSVDIPVSVLPVSIPAVFSNATPAMNEAVTVTAPGFIFQEGGAIIFGADTAIILSRAEDGSSVTFVPAPGSTGTAIIDSVSVDFLPDVKVSLPTAAEIAVAALTPAAGTGSTATAPSIPVPALGETVAYFDAGVFTAPDITGDGGLGAQYYTFTVTEDGDYRFVTNWAGGADIDAIVCFDAACVGGAFAGPGNAHPEDGTLTLTAGTYYFVSVLFAGTAPPNFSVTISR